MTDKSFGYYLVQHGQVDVRFANTRIYQVKVTIIMISDMMIVTLT